MAGLDAIKQLLGEKGKLQAPSSTRWLSVETCLSKLKLCFASVVLSLEREGEERSDAKAIGLHRLITQYRFVCTMLLMCDTLPHLTRMAKCFQMTECDYSIIPQKSHIYSNFNGTAKDAQWHKPEWPAKVLG